MVGSDMDVSEKLKSLSIDRAGSAKPAGGWKMAAIAGAGVALVGVAWALLGRGPAELRSWPVGGGRRSDGQSGEGRRARRGDLVDLDAPVVDAAVGVDAAVVRVGAAEAQLHDGARGGEVRGARDDHAGGGVDPQKLAGVSPSWLLGCQVLKVAKGMTRSELVR